jgi:hypothetical protein
MAEMILTVVLDDGTEIRERRKLPGREVYERPFAAGRLIYYAEALAIDVSRSINPMEDTDEHRTHSSR